MDINKNIYETSTRSYGSNHGRGGETWKAVGDSREVQPGVMQCAERRHQLMETQRIFPRLSWYLTPKLEHSSGIFSVEVCIM